MTRLERVLMRIMQLISSRIFPSHFRCLHPLEERVMVALVVSSAGDSLDIHDTPETRSNKALSKRYRFAYAVCATPVWMDLKRIEACRIGA